ncbi:mannose-6-phosphate isomerase [Staphylococcus petrasii]|uniref:type I phosphomannose isomerase catalytic subunit n=1 Tax=Staphylococcus petrasii TaxID=1276936 RepID=UPI000CD2FD3B|nr:type I phosphomannose isomerase catalytic subunit [Staphylococcus petrasii]PNZ80653.1 mannose-6-phosphate isomerase [Staphylococcus petrasii]TGA79993.1 class I mannose-6-phosphate isomerase [Staphylococcus petrasii]SUM59492.1 mannose-6-phosphate isomerase [Staphylococcus petrasii]
MPLFLKPIFHEKVWGGNQLRQFNYEIPSEHTGECWGISAHPNGRNVILNGPYAGQTLDQVWNDHRELFGEFPSKDFPLLCKIVDAKAPVHPDDAYAYEFENGQYGKSECWYIIDAEEDAEIILGTTLETKEELQRAIESNTLLDNLRKVKVKPGEFYFIPAGTIHSIGAGITAYETMQSSDISYRLYDYNRNRNDDTQLEIQKALDVTQFLAEIPSVIPENEIIENHKCSHIVSNDFFTMVKWEVSGTLNYMKPREFCLVSVLEGEGNIITDGEIFKLEKGSNFILTSEDLDSVFEGNFTLIISYI